MIALTEPSARISRIYRVGRGVSRKFPGAAFHPREILIRPANTPQPGGNDRRQADSTMRFYLKLGAFIVAFVLMHGWMEANSDAIVRTLFTWRCGIAWEYCNEDMIEQLVQEGQLQLRRDLARKHGGE
jgi:hypothetical protein